jgi:hypothetical protein
MADKNLSYARAQGVEFFFTFNAGSPTLDQVTVTPEFSPDDVNWYADEKQTLVINDAAEVASLIDRPIRHHVGAGSRQNQFFRLVFSTTTVQTPGSESVLNVSSRVTGVMSAPWTSDPQVAN